MRTMKKKDEAIPNNVKKPNEDRDEEEGFITSEQKGRSFLTTAAKEIKEDEIGGMDYDYEEEFDDDDEALFDEETEQVCVLIFIALYFIVSFFFPSNRR